MCVFSESARLVGVMKYEIVPCLYTHLIVCIMSVYKKKRKYTPTSAGWLGVLFPLVVLCSRLRVCLELLSKVPSLFRQLLAEDPGPFQRALEFFF